MPHVNAGDTAWLLASAAFVMFMTPGLAFFYGGLVRAKNVVGTVMQSFIALAVVTITWALIGYSLAFGPDKGGIIGGLDFFALNHVGGVPNAFAPTVPATTFMAFQMMFAIITPALIAGAFAERMKFSGYLMFIALWSIVVYAPLAHWEWGGGFLGADRRGGAGLRRRRGGPRERRCRGACYRDLPWPSSGPRVGRHVAPQRAVRDPRRRDPVVRLVRVQCRQRTRLGALASSALVNTQLGAAAAVLGVDLPRTGAGREGSRRLGPPRGRLPALRPSRRPRGMYNRWRLSRSVSSRVSCASRRCD